MATRKKSALKIGPKDSFEVTCANTGTLKKDYPRVMVGFNTGPEMYKWIMDHAKKQGFTGVKAKIITQETLRRYTGNHD